MVNLQGVVRTLVGGVNLVRVLDDDRQIGVRRLAILDVERPEVRPRGRRDDNHVDLLQRRLHVREARGRRLGRRAFEQLRARIGNADAQRGRLFKNALDAVPAVGRHVQQEDAFAREGLARVRDALRGVEGRAKEGGILRRHAGAFAQAVGLRDDEGAEGGVDGRERALARHLVHERVLVEGQRDSEVGERGPSDGRHRRDEFAA